MTEDEVLTIGESAVQQMYESYFNSATTQVEGSDVEFYLSYKGFLVQTWKFDDCLQEVRKRSETVCFTQRIIKKLPDPRWVTHVLRNANSIFSVRTLHMTSTRKLKIVQNVHVISKEWGANGISSFYQSWSP